jgi:uncharacterized cupin superfamily protein
MSIVAIKLDPATVAPEYDHPRPERLLRGNPQRSTWNVYSNASGEVFAGIWECEVGAWHIAMGQTEDELFTVLAGRCRLITADGASAVECGPGESLLIPAGFAGIFEVLEPMRKHYMIVERQQAVAQ